MKSEIEPTKILKKRCPRCASEIISHVPDNDFLKASIGIFKQIICTPCGNFQSEINRLEELKNESWTMISRLEIGIAKSKRARAAGSKTPDLSMKIAKMEEEIKVARMGLQKIIEKEESVLTQRGLHEQKLKERTEI